MTVNFWQALVGFSIGLIYSEIRDRVRSHHTKSKVRNSISKLFYFNLERCIQMEKQLTPNEKGEYWIPNYPFDTDTLKQVMFDGVGVFKTKEEQKEFNEINWIRYQLDHLNYKLAAINLSSDKDQLRPVFLTHLTQTKKEIEKILGGLI